MTPAPLQLGQAPSELALNSAGFTPLALANALRLGSSRPGYVAGRLRTGPAGAPGAACPPWAWRTAWRSGSSRPVYVAGLLRSEPRIAPWSMTTTPSRPATEPWISELLPEPATPATPQSPPSGRPRA